MPTVLRVRSYRFFFYAGDRDEPQHIHVEYGDKIAKFWLDPIRLQNSGGFSRIEINTNNINNVTFAVIPAKAGIQKHIDKPGFPPARE